MPHQKTITLYNFSELSDEQQEKVLDSFRHINVDVDWHVPIYEDAEKIGLKITGFNIERNTITGYLKLNVLDVCKLIRKNHGKDTETRKTARNFLKKYIAEFNLYRGNDKKYLPVLLEEFESEDEAKDIEIDFSRALLEDYLIILKKEYEYLISDKAVKETIELNEMEFMEL